MWTIAIISILINKGEKVPFEFIESSHTHTHIYNDRRYKKCNVMAKITKVQKFDFIANSTNRKCGKKTATVHEIICEVKKMAKNK